MKYRMCGHLTMSRSFKFEIRFSNEILASMYESCTMEWKRPFIKLGMFWARSRAPNLDRMLEISDTSKSSLTVSRAGLCQFLK